MTSMWMVRSDGGKRYDDFRDLTAVGIGFPEIAKLAQSGADRKALLNVYSDARPGIKQHSAMSAASQVYRFVNEIDVGDLVVTHSPTNRRYLVGTVRAAWLVSA
jgi:restriction system protein